jgi:hypothetical protein
MEPSGRDIFTMGIGIPAMIAWIAYGLCWLIEPRLATDQNPLIWAAYAAGGWYLIIAVLVGGPCILMGL